ncbi:DUF962-domain-containing protein [Massarina eburnea CBS 473.64]|uniref:DUF962-domain-containing protein n=1 Tax=Massarina eburnea CBS 473.64 TaxID=1395130 RepID=A0A6A6RL64_9PLEO|nr:DUF962-domain-containing protein [Massarina eburnea CBS 473.64]
MSLNLEKQMRLYGAYHHNSVNVVIHVVCVPAILMTFVVLFTNTPSVPLPSWLSVPYLPLNAGTFGVFIYSTLYILMEPVAGALLTPLLIGGAACANHLASTYGATANYWAGGINAVSWIAQFVGHGAFEGRAPALLNNLVQALFLAPFFVWFEILFSLGYRPDLKNRLDKAVEEDMKKFKGKKGTEANGAANGTKKTS